MRGRRGREWQLAYLAQQQEGFAKQWGSALKLGDTIGGSISEDIVNLDNRTIEDKHITSLSRY